MGTKAKKKARRYSDEEIRELIRERQMKYHVWNMPLDPSRPMLEQFEERALYDDEAREWLIKEIYGNAEIIGEMCGVHPIRKSTEVVHTGSTQGQSEKRPATPEEVAAQTAAIRRLKRNARAAEKRLAKKGITSLW